MKRVDSYVVTVKLPRNPAHDPRNKVTGLCPVGTGACTDVTGEHHSYVTTGESIEAVRQSAIDAGWRHVTRVEEVAIWEMT